VRLPRSRRGLVALNLALLSALALAALVPAAGAQNAAPPGGRARGDYMMGAGRLTTGNAAAYIVDASNQEMIVLRWDGTRKSLSSMGYRNLGADARLRQGR